MGRWRGKRKEEEGKRKKTFVWWGENGNAPSCCGLCICFGLRKVNMCCLVKVSRGVLQFSDEDVLQRYLFGESQRSMVRVWYRTKTHITSHNLYLFASASQQTNAHHQHNPNWYICTHLTVFQYRTPEIQSSTFLHPSIQTLAPTNEPSQISARSERGKRNHRFTKRKPLFPSIFPYRRQLRQNPRRCFVLMTSYESPAPRWREIPPTQPRNEGGKRNKTKMEKKVN